jgi:hypothetical protein
MTQEPVKQRPSKELKNTTYELFMGALSVLAIVNLFIGLLLKDRDVVDVVLLMDGALSVIFLGDFLYRFFSVSAKATYFFRQFGWADLVASLPFPQAKLFRLFRTFRSGRLIRHIDPQNIQDEYVSNRGGSALLTLLILMILVVQFGAMAILAVEHKSPDSNIKNAGDALWYMYVTITTVGYGDRFPVTNWGRLIGVVVLAMGVGLYSTLTGFLTNTFLAPKKEEPTANEDAQAPKAEAQPSISGTPTPSAEAEVDPIVDQLKEQAATLTVILQLLTEQERREVEVRKRGWEIEAPDTGKNSSSELQV